MTAPPGKPYEPRKPDPAKPYEPGDPWFEKALAVLLVPVWRVVAWLGDRGWRR